MWAVLFVDLIHLVVSHMLFVHHRTAGNSAFRLKGYNVLPELITHGDTLLLLFYYYLDILLYFKAKHVCNLSLRHLENTVNKILL